MDNSIRVVEGERSARFEFESKDEVDKGISDIKSFVVERLFILGLCNI